MGIITQRYSFLNGSCIEGDKAIMIGKAALAQNIRIGVV
jgi:hypothetical protein